MKFVMLLVRDLFFFDEHVCPCAVRQFGGHLIRNPFEFAHCDHLIDQK
ncbi:MAG: hypothetical protein ACJAUW_002075, partial [Yoonia sp.]